jgi:hypothetical protein
MNEQELRDFEELFATNAWRRMVKDAEDAIREREAAALGARSFEEVCFYRGEVAQLSVLVSLEQAIAMAKLARLEEDDY